MKRGVFVLLASLLALALASPAANASAWRTIFDRRVQIATYTEVNHACLAKARQLSKLTHEFVLCTRVVAERTVWTGWRRGMNHGFYHVEWIDGWQKGLTYSYGRFYYWKGGFFPWRFRLTHASPLYGPVVVRRDR